MDKKVPKDSTISKRKEKFPWLLVTDSDGDRKMICTICKSQEEKLKLMPLTNMIFINGSANFKSSTLSNHITTDGYKRVVKEKNHEDAISAGSSTHPEKAIHEKWSKKRKKHWSNFTI